MKSQRLFLLQVMGLLALLVLVNSRVIAAELEWTACPVPRDRVRCGMLSVPENWAQQSSSRTIRVHFVHVAARDLDNRKSDPVAVLTGGPGVSIYYAYESMQKLAVNQTRDVIAMEPRGYGYSDPWLGCAGVDELANCYAKAKAEGIDVTQYTTSASVRDYEALRHALGYDRWNIAGVSYGTYWSSQYARMYPESIRSIVMDSPYPLHAGYDWNRVAALNALELVFNDCRADSNCNRAFPDLRQRFVQTMLRLIDQPDQWGETLIGPHEAFDPIFHTVYISTSLHRTPILVDALARGDYQAFFDLAHISPFSVPEGIDTSRLRSLGLNASMLCMEDIFYPASVETRVAFTAAWPEAIVKVINPEGWDYDRRCAAWPVPRHDPVINTQPQIDIPSLVMVGGYDPVTPPEFAEAMLLHMNQGTLALDPSTAHVLFLNTENTCIAHIMQRFIDDPAAHQDLSCLVRRKPVPWQLPD